MGYHIGIDPGKTGAVGLISDGGWYLEVYDAPVDEEAWIQLSLEIVAGRGAPLAVWVEFSQSGVFGQGKVGRQSPRSAHTSGLTYGHCRYFAASFRGRWDMVKPVAWKKACGLIGKDKEDSRLKARRLWPEAPLDRKKDHGRAEALLIAEWGRLHGGVNI